MQVTAYNDLNTSDVTSGLKNNTAKNSGSSLFNALLAKNSNAIEDINTKAKDAITTFNEVEENNSITSDMSNTHDELTLMLKFKNLQAS